MMTIINLLAWSLVAQGSPAQVVLKPVEIPEMRRRLVRLALEQSEKESGYWDPGQRDCAGFVRFIYKSVLGAQAPLWLNREGQRVHFLQADELLSYNFEFLAKNVRPENLNSGDVLAFYNPNKKRDQAWHLMMLLKDPLSPQRNLLVYHNGDSGRKAKVRKIWLKDLVSQTSRWQPVATNRLFLGVYRYKNWRALQ